MAAQNAREGETGVAKDGEAKLRVKLDVDISDALTGLKALQREAREATKALRELEEAQSTKMLHEALAQREGVEEYFVNAHGGYAKLSIDNGDTGVTITVEGPARIIVSKD